MNKMALLIIDVQNALMWENPWRGAQMIENIKSLQQTAREHGVEVIFIQHCEEDNEFAIGQESWKIYDEIAPLEHEKVIYKHFNSAFRDTTLELYLEDKGIETLMTVGMQTEYCFDATIKVGFELGYEMLIPESTNTTFDGKKIGRASCRERV